MYEGHFFPTNRNIAIHCIYICAINKIHCIYICDISKISKTIILYFDEAIIQFDDYDTQKN